MEWDCLEGLYVHAENKGRVIDPASGLLTTSKVSNDSWEARLRVQRDF